MRTDTLSLEQLSTMVKMARRKKTPKEISAALGIDANHVRVRLCRMRKDGTINLPDAFKQPSHTDAEVLEFFVKHKRKTVSQIHRDTGHSREYINKLMDRWMRLT